MCRSSINLEVKLGEVEYIDENTVNIPIYLRQKDSNKEFSRIDKIAKFNGQAWQTVDNE